MANTNVSSLLLVLNELKIMQKSNKKNIIIKGWGLSSR